jgi:hypothetical protein
MSANEHGRSSRLYVQTINSGDPIAISAEGVRLEPWHAHTVSPDGRVVIAIGPNNKAALYPIARGTPDPLTVLADDLVPIGWSDRPNVLYARPRGLSRLSAVYRVDLSTHRRELWQTVGPTDLRGAPRMYTMLISPDGGRYAYSSNQSRFDLFLIEGAFSNAINSGR